MRGGIRGIGTWGVGRNVWKGSGEVMVYRKAVWGRKGNSDFGREKRTSKRKSLDKENISKQGRNLKTRIKEGDFDDIDDMVDKAIEYVEGDTVNADGAVNTATIGVSAASASVTTAGVSISTHEPRTPPTTTIKAFEDVDITISQTLVKMGSKGKGIIQEPKKPPKNSRMAQIQMDEELALRLHKEEKINNFIHMDSEAVKDSAKKDDSSQKQAESTKKRPRAEYDEESVKKQKLEDDTKEEELRACLDIVPRDDIAINVESLATKYLIVDWKTHILTENIMYYHIIRANGSSKNYKIFTEICDDFDRHDVLDLYRLVKQRYETISPKGYDRLLWEDLITLFEPNEEDEI
uniref:Uncharacterized protein n=1 Tax=Tanacetum cinerariifolium TaxID=118510 RepID=A0A6L2M2A3_TANCI|nr:hypothetical protein [Tanacetum cinerariifolium]